MLFNDWVVCNVASISRDYDTYVGSNAYGASRTVKRTHGRDFAIAIAKGSAVHKYSIYSRALPQRQIHVSG